MALSNDIDLPMPCGTPIFEWRDDAAFYRGLPVDHETIDIDGRTFTIAGLKDAADLLDQDEFAAKFIDDSQAPYGMELWPAAPMMARHILAGEDGHDRAALDLGCGLGLVSIAAAIKGWRITAADHETEALAFARYNAALNSVDVPAYRELDWHDPPEGLAFDRIFAGDILYELVNHVPILKCISKLLAENGTALIADPRRSVADRFAELATEHGFAVSMIPTEFTFRTRGLIAGRIYSLAHGADRR